MTYRFVIEETTDQVVYQRVKPILDFIGINLDYVAHQCRALLPGRFIYRGGCHVAIHKSDGDPTRIGLIVESES